MRLKESDRIETTARELSRLGADIKESSDGMIVHGGRPLLGAEVRSHFDHRLAMTLAIAGLVAKGVTSIRGSNVAEVSYPGFWVEMENLANRKMA